MRSADDGEGTPPLTLEELGSAHIDEFHVALVIDHDVLGLDVAVDDGVCMQVLHAQNQRSNVELTIVGVEESYVTDHVEEFESLDVLDDEVDVVVVLQWSNELHDKRELNTFQHTLFLEQMLLERLLHDLILHNTLQAIQFLIDSVPHQVH